MEPGDEDDKDVKWRFRITLKEGRSGRLRPESRKPNKTNPNLSLIQGLELGGALGGREWWRAFTKSPRFLCFFLWRYKERKKKCVGIVV